MGKENMEDSLEPATVLLKRVHGFLGVTDNQEGLPFSHYVTFHLLSQNILFMAWFVMVFSYKIHAYLQHLS